MPDKDKHNKGKKSKKESKPESIPYNTTGNCPEKDGDNCLVPGGFNDSDPIGGG